MGDENNKFFSAAIKERIQKKQIIEITSLQGFKLTKQQDIKDEIQRFYQGLMGTTIRKLPAASAKVMRKGPVINQQQGIALCQPVTDEEIYKCLKFIDDDKALGVDEFNALLYKKAWSLIRREVIVAVRRFFITGKMYSAINCTSITLVPKKLNPATVNK